ncbi:dentin sialophosphoprotein-like [Hylaeus anthracinus]|uniref:dentin sialophosphoprotein-like n=1 Tax=Hylaeus anthracinus TaxID=313031 RepID=UPI0023B9FD15|nr:dentin sialophosphoprotein-like [Hylaeus anthracinus]
MAQRKSLNRRPSRYSRLSVGSAILDPNTGILDEEYPYWWQGLDNTTVRPSMGSDTLNQTGRYLYSDSSIEPNTVEDRWWDILESLNNSKTPMATKDYSKEGRTDTASTSESEGEPRIVKRKCTLQSKAMNSRDNAFSDVLNNFETAILPEPRQESMRDSSIHSSVSVEKTLSNAEQLNNSQGSSRNHSLTTSIVKVRPRIFGKKYKDQNTNVFDDILNTDELESPLKKQSLRISLTKELLTSTNDNPPATASTLVVNSTQHNHRTVSPENKNYCSASSSQSTVVNNNFAYTRDNNKDSTASDAETTVLKPKSKFLNRHNKIVNENETDESTRKSIAAETKTFKRPSASAADNPVEFLQPVSRNITSVDSSDSSNTSQRDDPPKKKSVFLNRLRENRKRNLFLDILQESDDSIIHETSRSKASVNHSRERNLVNENSKEIRERQLVSDESSRNSMENVLLKYSGPLNVDNNDTINSSNKINSNVSKMLAPETATTSRSGNSEEEQSIDSAVSLIEQSKEKHTSQNNTNANSGIHCNESSIRKSVSQNEKEYVPEVDKSITDNTRTRSPAKIPNDSSQDDEYITKTQSGTWTRLENQKQRGTTDLESEKDESTLKKRSKHFASLQNKSASPTTDENQQGQVQNVSGRESEGLDRSQKRSTSAIPNEEALDKNDITKRQSRNISKSQNLSSRFVTSSDEEEIDVPKRQSKSLGRSQKISWNPNILKKLSVSITKLQDTRLHSSERQSGLNRVSEFEALGNQTSSKKPTRKSRRIQKLLSSSTENEVTVERHEDTTTMQNRQSDSEAEIHTPSKRQRKKLSKSQKQSALGIAGEVEAEQSKDTTNMQSRKSGLEPDIQTPSKRQSKRFSRSQKQSALDIAEEVEAEQSKDTTMQSRESDSETEVETPSKRQSKRFSRSHKLSALDIATEDVSEQDRDTASELRKESTVVDAGESNKNKSQDNANVRYKTLNNLSKTLKQVNTTAKSTKRLTFNLNNPNDKEDASASNATMNIERNSTQPCNIGLTNVLQNTNKDAQTVGRRSIGNVSRSSRPNVSENRKTPNKATGSVAPSKMLINRIPTSSTSQRNIKDFFQVEKSLPASQVFADKQKLEEVKMKMEILKERVLAAMKPIQKNPEPRVLSQRLKPNNVAKAKKSTQTKEINKAFLVNGKVYKVPRLARPKPWITNRLYKFLWKKMNSKYGPNTRVVSEKFVRQLSEITTLIEKRKLYSKYESELLALMKEMARLNIIETRLDFYHFCQDFLPYELRFKMVPMLLPGNKRNIPYDPDKVYEPLLRD